MAYMLAAGELTVPTYSSRPKTSPPRRRPNSSTPSTVKQESDTELESLASSLPLSTMDTENFPASEPLRPVFCCTSVTPKDENHAYKLGTTSLILQRGRLVNFVDYIAEYSLSSGVPVVDDLAWSERAEYLVKVIRYRQEDAPEPSPGLPTRRNRKLVLVFGRRGRGNAKLAAKLDWQQAAPGRHFVEMRHEKRQRLLDHAFDEVLITEGLEDIPGCFEKVEKVTMEAVCPAHSGVKWVCEFWAKME